MIALAKERLYCGNAKLDPAVLKDVVYELLVMLDRQYGNIATVTARKFKNVKASRTEIGRALKLLHYMNILEPSGDRRGVARNGRSYIIHKNSRQELVQILMHINKS